MPSPRWSVIVPALDEERALPRLLESLRRQEASHEVLVVDGGSGDATPRTARALGARLLSAPAGRASQMNAGARQARGRHLLFAHADMTLPPGALAAAGRALAEAGTVAGCFETRFRSPHPLLWGGRWKTHLWVRLLGFAPGDHGLFLDRALFEALGGFPAVPLMEEVELCRRLRRLGRLRVVRPAAEVSARRFHAQGVVSTYARMARVLLWEALGASPHRLVRIYRGNPR